MDSTQDQTEARPVIRRILDGLPSLRDRYSRLFAIDEIRASARLRAVYWASWGLALFDLHGISWAYNSPLRGAYLWEHWLGTGISVSIGQLPESYAYTKLMACVLLIIALSGISAVRKRWEAAHFFLMLALLFKFTWNLVIFDYGTSNFELFHLVPSFMLLFARSKVFHLRYIWALLYLFSAFVKLDDGWITGSYFSSLKLGLPFVPDSLIPFATHAVILCEVVLSVGLLAGGPRLAKASLWWWSAFHFYSAILVGYYYPIRCLAMLWTIFGLPETDQDELRPNARRTLSLGGIAVLLYVLAGNFASSVVSPDVSRTFEAMNYGLHMIDANHQCLNTFKVVDDEGKTIQDERSFGTSGSMARCYPQRVLQKLKQVCRNHSQGGKEVRVEWKLLHSKNGQPFYELVNTQNACALEYTALRHNDWLRAPASGSRIAGYPEKNSVNNPLNPVGKPVVHPEPVIRVSPMESWLYENYQPLKTLYSLYWGIIFSAFIAFYLGREGILRAILRSTN